MTRNGNTLILIVDDNSRNLQFLGNLLSENEYDVGFAKNGAKALDFVFNEPPDLILLDIMMPVMNGYEVCEKLKADASTRHIPIIFLTAKNQADAIVKGFEVGGVDYVIKPFNSAELLARVKVHIEVKILRGLLPICVNCKNIRDDEGIWKRIEAYLEVHAEVLFSHGLCPNCTEDLYGDQEWYKKKHGKK
ncbi:MAG: response regulator [bacterium]|nr:response regulator [bacterium]